jgi:hypothetical protein
MNRLIISLAVLVVFLSVATQAEAKIIRFEANLTGAEEVPPTTSAATGLGIVMLDDQAMTITVDLSFQGLSAPAMGAHIHEAPMGVNGTVEFPLNLGATLGKTAGTIMTQTRPLTDGAADVQQFLNGEYYFNIHSNDFTDGEIRGQINLVPEPSMWAAGGVGVLLVGLRRRWQPKLTG